MRLGRDQLRPVCSPLIGFRGIKVQLVSTITLPVVVGSYPQQITKEVNFLVVDYSSSYNTIIGRPTLNSWKAVTSTYHLSVKFPTEHEIGQAQGDQLAARECYLAMMACSGGVIPTANNQVSQFPCGGLFVLVQCHYWKTNSKQLEGSNIHLPSISQIPY